MLALGALSLARDRNSRLNSVRHYGNALSDLRDLKDPMTDGVFLTHFLLLSYEVSYVINSH